MSAPADTALSELLENAVDLHNLQKIIRTLALICHEKAAHLASAWQDERAADAWTMAGCKLDGVALLQSIAVVS